MAPRLELRHAAGADKTHRRHPTLMPRGPDSPEPRHSPECKSEYLDARGVHRRGPRIKSPPTQEVVSHESPLRHTSSRPHTRVGCSSACLRCQRANQINKRTVSRSCSVSAESVSRSSYPARANEAAYCGCPAEAQKPTAAPLPPPPPPPSPSACGRLEVHPILCATKSELLLGFWFVESESLIGRLLQLDRMVTFV